MDLAKIIAELRLELQCLDAAIASVAELARVQNLSDEGVRPGTPPEPPEPFPPEPLPPEPVTEGAAPVKRRRGRPRKNAASAVAETPQPKGPGSAQSSGDSTASAA